MHTRGRDNRYLYSASVHVLGKRKLNILNFTISRYPWSPRALIGRRLEVYICNNISCFMFITSFYYVGGSLGRGVRPLFAAMQNYVCADIFRWFSFSQANFQRTWCDLPCRGLFPFDTGSSHYNCYCLLSILFRFMAFYARMWCYMIRVYVFSVWLCACIWWYSSINSLHYLPHGIRMPPQICLCLILNGCHFAWSDLFVN